MKSAYYTALVTNAYRIAIDSYLSDPLNYSLDKDLLTELDSVSHREYCTGYYLDEPKDEANLCTISGYIREKAYFATSIDHLSLPERLEAETEGGKLYTFIQRNKVKVGDKADVISPGSVGKSFTVSELYSEKGEPIESAPHPGMKFFVRVPFEVKVGDIMRSGE
jgi:putative protease